MENKNEIIEEVNEIEEVYEEEMENETEGGITLGKILLGLILSILGIFGITKAVKYFRNKRNNKNVETEEQVNVETNKKNKK